MKGALISVSDKLLLRKRAIIETVNDELKNIAQIAPHERLRALPASEDGPRHQPYPFYLIDSILRINTGRFIVFASMLVAV